MVIGYETLVGIFPGAQPQHLSEFGALVEAGAVTVQRLELATPEPADAMVAFSQERGLASTGWRRDLGVLALRWLNTHGQRTVTDTKKLFDERADLATANGSVAVLCGAASPALALQHLAAGRHALVVPYSSTDDAPCGWLLKPTRAFSQGRA